MSRDILHEFIKLRDSIEKEDSEAKEILANAIKQKLDSGFKKSQLACQLGVSVTTINRYLKKEAFPKRPLRKKLEEALSIKIERKIQNREYITKRNELVEKYMFLVEGICRKYAYRLSGGIYEFEDLVQEGVLGLIEALEHYSPGVCDFKTYAYYWIRAYVLDFLSSPETTAFYNHHTLYLDDSAYHDSNSRTLHEKIPDPSPENTEYLDFKNLLEKSNLTPREKEVMLKRYSGLTLERIGEDLGITRERVRQIYNRAIRKTRSYFE